jgi:sugar lactone lactonase YvrE
MNVTMVSTVAGSGEIGFKDGAAAEARFYRPEDVAVDQFGNLYVADESNHSIRKISPDGLVTTFAGSRNGDWGSLDGPSTEARFASPSGVAVDGAGNLYVADWGNHSIRKISPSGETSTLAGVREPGFRDAQGSEARFREPNGIAVDAAGIAYVADTGNHAIRTITPDGTVRTLAGSGEAGFTEGMGRAARFNLPFGIAVDGVGNVFVADTGNNRIRRITPDGTVTTLAGSVTAGSADGIGLAASFNTPFGLALDRHGTLYVTDEQNHAIRTIAPDGRVSTLAGVGIRAFTDGEWSVAAFNSPHGIAVDAAGNVYVADVFNHRIRKIVPARGQQP